ncbi:MAG TPA: hypothetical protein VGI40_25380 [Pirellulaceae bacterium]
MNWQRSSIWLAIGLSASVWGCGPNYGGRQEIKGTIKLKGQPLDQGLITFLPISGNGTTQEGAPIANGQYNIDRAHGLMPGKYRISITAGDGQTRADAPADQPPGPTGANIISKDRIPPEYNTKSEHEVDVAEKKPNVFDYDIP